MIFSTFDFLFFLPITVLGFYLVGKLNYRLPVYWLTLVSVLFYASWSIEFLPVLLLSIIVNYSIASIMFRTKKLLLNKLFVTMGIIFNLGLLGCFKYANFFLENFSLIAGTEPIGLSIVLPLAISFFTFQQIAYLVDCYYHKAHSLSFVRYTLFVSFFPQLIAGPIVHHEEMMPQFNYKYISKANWNNIALGLFVFLIGLFKKVVIADNLSPIVSFGFDQSNYLTFLDSATVSLSYALQLYFDFSGYTDMAIGAALLFNINLPQNFNSPYKSLNIQDFWRRWHITLSRFLRDYIYVPLGGNRKGVPIQIYAILITFLLGGLWHGASWNFVLWGALHGIMLVIFTFYKKYFKYNMPITIAWSLNFIFIIFTWILFRASDYESLKVVLSGFLNFETNLYLNDAGYEIDAWFCVYLLSLILLCVKAPNSNDLMKLMRANIFWLLFVVILGVVSFWQIGGYSEFLYFQF